MMTLDFVAVRPAWTVRESLDYIRTHGYDRETLNMVYVTDEAGHLLDDIRVRRFLLAEPETKVSALMDGNYSTVAPSDDDVPLSPLTGTVSVWPPRMTR